MGIFLYPLVIIICSLGISKSASFVIDSIVRLAQRARISDFTLGFFILGIATTTPEIFIGINSAVDGVPQLSMGNLLGGIIVLLSLVVGLVAVITGKVSFRDTFTPKEMLFTAFLIISPSFLIFDGFISRVDGLLLLVFYLVFFVIMNRKETFIEHIRDEIFKEPLDVFKLTVKLILGIAGLILFSKIIVGTALTFSNLLSIPALVIGLLLLSIGTNLPELSLGVATRNHHKQLAIGSFLGSAAANIPVLGLVALIYPISIPSTTKVIISIFILLLTVGCFSYFAQTKRTITRKEGFLLLLIYTLFLLSELLSNSWTSH